LIARLGLDNEILPVGQGDVVVSSSKVSLENRLVYKTDTAITLAQRNESTPSTMEVPKTWQYNVYQTISKLVHPLITQCNFKTDLATFTQLKASNRLLSSGRYRPLAGTFAEVSWRFPVIFFFRPEHVQDQR